MSDDLFSKLFELFDQPGPINWKLAAEVGRHLAGEPQPVEPWAAEEFRELTRLAEYRVEQIAPFRLISAPDVIPVDARGWMERNLESFGSLIEPFASSVVADGPAAEAPSHYAASGNESCSGAGGRTVRIGACGVCSTGSSSSSGSGIGA